ncbi:MAG: DUF4263 domain-containing protein [Gammaproteobacteria bacterium]|nr:DUF4263 domain-containing protein [Gammaproteobacteria bacterium]
MRFFQHRNDEIHGELIIESSSDGIFEVYYFPPPSRIPERKIGTSVKKDLKTKILEINHHAQELTIFPINITDSRRGFLEPKYNRVIKLVLSGASIVVEPSSLNSNSSNRYIRSITFQEDLDPLDPSITDSDIDPPNTTMVDVLDILENLPSGFTKDYDYGLGLASRYRVIIEKLEELTNCTTIVFTHNEPSRADESIRTFYLNFEEFHTIRRWINSTENLKQAAEHEVQMCQLHNFYAEILDIPRLELKFGRDRRRKFFTKILSDRDESLSIEGQLRLVDLMTKNLDTLTNRRPERILRLQNDIEIANLERFTDEFRTMLTKELNEGLWQSFFKNNPAILSFAFGQPYLMIGEQASVGGQKIDGSGTSITDFLYTHAITRNVAVLEIKKPSSPLLLASPYRNEVYGPSRELSGSVIQVLDQKYNIERDIYRIKDLNKLTDIQSYAVQCLLLIGMMPGEDEKQKSFELYRNNLNAVLVVTFDELLSKIEQLLKMLNDSTEVSVSSSVEDLPF